MPIPFPAPARRPGRALLPAGFPAMVPTVVPLLVAAALGASGLMGAAAALAQSGPAEPTMQDVQQLLRDQRHADAFGRLMALADRGEAGAALLALAMLQHGPTLYGSDWSATPGQLRRWTALAAREARALSLRAVAFERVE